MSRDRIERTVVVAAPIERVWAVITRAEHIASWFSDTAEVDLRPGGSLTLGFAALDMSEAEQDHHREDNTEGWRIKTEELRAYAEKR
jgi:uncharacterized protein YndB with AHSA1/START domain